MFLDVIYLLFCNDDHQRSIAYLHILRRLMPMFSSEKVKKSIFCMNNFFEKKFYIQNSFYTIEQLTSYHHYSRTLCNSTRYQVGNLNVKIALTLNLLLSSPDFLLKSERSKTQILLSIISLNCLYLKGMVFCSVIYVNNLFSHSMSLKFSSRNGRELFQSYCTIKCTF